MATTANILDIVEGTNYYKLTNTNASNPLLIIRLEPHTNQKHGDTVYLDLYSEVGVSSGRITLVNSSSTSMSSYPENNIRLNTLGNDTDTDLISIEDTSDGARRVLKFIYLETLHGGTSQSSGGNDYEWYVVEDNLYTVD